MSGLMFHIKELACHRTSGESGVARYFTKSTIRDIIVLLSMQAFKAYLISQSDKSIAFRSNTHVSWLWCHITHILMASHLVVVNAKQYQEINLNSS